MSDRDLRNLYENVRRGDEYTQPTKLENLYFKVLREATSKDPQNRPVKDRSDNVQTMLGFDDDVIDTKYQYTKSNKKLAGVKYEPTDADSLHNRLQFAAGSLIGVTKPTENDQTTLNNIIMLTKTMLSEADQVMDEDIIEVLMDLSRNKIEKDLPIGEKFNWIDWVAENHKSKYIHSGVKEYIHNISKLSGKGSVSVGWPELAGIIFLANTVKAGGILNGIKTPNAGDLIRNGRLIEVKAKDARMGKGSPVQGFKGIDEIISNLVDTKTKEPLQPTRVGTGSSSYFETFVHWLKTIAASPTITRVGFDMVGDNEIKSIILSLYTHATPKESVVDTVVQSFHKWATNKSIADLTNDIEVIKNIMASIHMLYYRHTDGHNFNTLWTCDQQLNSFVFNIEDSTTFEEIYNIISSKFVVSKTECDGFMGAAGICLL